MELHMYYTHMYTIIFARYETVVYAKSEYWYIYVNAHMHVQHMHMFSYQKNRL